MNWKIIIVLITILNFFIYPIIDSRRDEDKGSTGDDAIILAANTLKSTGKMYDITINNHTPISPGPAWVLLNSPFVLLDIYFLFTPFYIFIFLYFINYYYKKKIKPIFYFLLFSSMVFWELFLNGHDIIPFSISLFTTSQLVYYQSIKKNNIYITFLISILVGIISTSRIIFIFYPFLLSLLLWKFNKKNSIILLIISYLVFFGFNIYYYSINEYYQPLHLINKAYKTIGIPIILTGGLTFLVVLLLLYSKVNKTIESWNQSIFNLFLILFTFIGLGSLPFINFDFTIWEGANYIFPIIPFYIYLASFKVV